MTEREFDLGREELRALLVLGIIGTLLAVRDVLKGDLAYSITFTDITTLLMAYWGAYLFLMVIGISGDLVRRRVANACAIGAAFFFLLGIGSTIGMFLFTMLALVLARFIDPNMAFAVSIIVGLASTIIATILLVPRNDESA
jgi:hypothetical protein